MILTANNDPSRQIAPADIRLLAECDRVTSFTECGWFCVLGFKGQDRLVHVHANSFEDVERLAARHGYRFTGCDLTALSDVERAEVMARYSYRGDYQARTKAPAPPHRSARASDRGLGIKDLATKVAEEFGSGGDRA